MPGFLRPALDLRHRLQDIRRRQRGQNEDPVQAHNADVFPQRDADANNARAAALVLQPAQDNLDAPNVGQRLTRNQILAVVRRFSTCQVSRGIMVDPLVTEAGGTYEGAFIRQWLNGGNHIDPNTNIRIGERLVPNIALQQLIAALAEELGDLDANVQEPVLPLNGRWDALVQQRQSLNAVAKDALRANSRAVQDISASIRRVLAENPTVAAASLMCGVGIAVPSAVRALPSTVTTWLLPMAGAPSLGSPIMIGASLGATATALNNNRKEYVQGGAVMVWMLLRVMALGHAMFAPNTLAPDAAANVLRTVASASFELGAAHVVREVTLKWAVNGGLDVNRSVGLYLGLMAGGLTTSVLGTFLSL